MMSRIMLSASLSAAMAFVTFPLTAATTPAAKTDTAGNYASPWDGADGSAS